MEALFDIYEVGEKDSCNTVDITPVFSPSGVQAVNPSGCQLHGSISDDGELFSPTSNLWTLVSGPAPVVFNDPNETNTFVQFSQPGTYDLRLLAYDGQFTSNSDVQITVVGSQQSSLNVLALKLILYLST